MAVEFGRWLALSVVAVAIHEGEIAKLEVAPV